METPPGAQRLVEVQAGTLPDVLGLAWDEIAHGFTRSRLVVERRHMAPNGYLHAASVVALADTACGYGCMASLPAGAQSFTTLELKTNFLATARDGETIACEARLVHGGRTTQVWDAMVVNETQGGRTVALFRCTQMILYPR